MALAAPAALQHLGSLVLGEHALQLQQQAVLGRVPDRAIEEDHLRAGLGELLDQQNLMRVAAGEAIRGMDVDEIDGREGHEVAQTLQGGSDQTGAAVAVVDEPHVIAESWPSCSLARSARPFGCRWCDAQPAGRTRPERRWRPAGSAVPKRLSGAEFSSHAPFDMACLRS